MHSCSQLTPFVGVGEENWVRAPLSKKAGHTLPLHLRSSVQISILLSSPLFPHADHSLPLASGWSISRTLAVITGVPEKTNSHVSPRNKGFSGTVLTTTTYVQRQVTRKRKDRTTARPEFFYYIDKGGKMRLDEFSILSRYLPELRIITS